VHENATLAGEKNDFALIRSARLLTFWMPEIYGTFKMVE